MNITSLHMLLPTSNSSSPSLSVVHSPSSSSQKPSSNASHSHGKKLSSAFDGTLTCYLNLTTELFLTSCIIILTYIFENYWFFEHSEKVYSRDLFIFVCVVFFLYAIYTIKPITDLTLLGRDQTEEWKGWMQFIFLLYHYFHAEEVYNSVRVMITCYVWMTGFGNFSFFYIKQDYGWLRIVQMLWRLNFAVFFLMLIHGNTYILYYICPLHTFYFCMVYVTMFIMQSVNHTMWGIRIKLLFVGILIFLIWDVSGEIFDTVFFFLGTESTVGAKLGTLWEWYFRSSLDHWSTFYGMIFALNFPLAEQYFKLANGWSLAIAGIILFGLSVWWYLEIYSLDKLAYNLHHSYFAFIPLTAYIFFRNITPTVRSGVSMSLHTLGKTTLETYLLQHHVWLTSNAKTLLTLIPGMPWVNFALASVLFYFLSHELYRLTMSLRGMILPENKDIAFRNMIGSFLVFIFFALAAFILQKLETTWIGIGLASLVVFLILSIPIKKYSRGLQENELLQGIWKKMTFLCVILFFVGLGYEFSNTSSKTTQSTSQSLTKIPSIYDDTSLIQQCHQKIPSGYWNFHNNCPQSSGGLEIPAHCISSEWRWNQNADATNCKFHQIKSTESLNIYRNHQIFFMGDSTIRAVYHRFNKLLNPKYTEPLTGKHSNFIQQYRDYNITVEFRWTPFLSNITSELSSMARSSSPSSLSVNSNIFILGATLWDILYFHKPSEYQLNLRVLSQIFQPFNEEMKNNIFWILPLHIVNEKLNTDDKKKYMTEEIVENYRQLTINSPLGNTIQYLDSNNITLHREEESFDGVHYTGPIYDVLVQFISNSYLLDHYREVIKSSSSSASSSSAVKTSSSPPKPKPTGSMSETYFGLITLFVAAIMLMTWDNFFGLGWLSLKLTSKSYDWNEAYLPLLKKILPHNYRDTEVDEEKKPMIELNEKD